jgi:hypothetical protein
MMKVTHSKHYRVKEDHQRNEMVENIIMDQLHDRDSEAIVMLEAPKTAVVVVNETWSLVYGEFPPSVL